MNTSKVTIKNKQDQSLVLLIDKPQDAKGIVFIMHGLGGTKEKPHLETIADTFVSHGYIAVRFDTRNTFGESDGKYEDATITTYYEDLEDVIAWAQKQSWYKDPFYLAGHSLGGIATAVYAQRHTHIVKGLVSLSSVISGSLTEQTDYYKQAIPDWQKTKWLLRGSDPKKRLPWSHMQDRYKYDLLKEANVLTMPVLIVVGDQDDRTPPDHQQLFYEKISGEKKLHVVKNAPHTFAEKEHIEELKSVLDSWITNVGK